MGNGSIPKVKSPVAKSNPAQSREEAGNKDKNKTPKVRNVRFQRGIQRAEYVERFVKSSMLLLVGWGGMKTVHDQSKLRNNEDDKNRCVLNGVVSRRKGLLQAAWNACGK